MNFNFTHSNEYSLNNSLICECIKLYGIEAKLLKTEKINLDKEVFGDWSSIKTNSSDVFTIHLLPDNAENFDFSNYQFGDFGFLNTEQTSVYCSAQECLKLGFDTNSLMSSLVVLPSNKVMEITNIEILNPGVNNLWAYSDAKCVFKLSLNTYNFKLHDEIKNSDITATLDIPESDKCIKDKIEDEIDSIDALDNYFEKLIKTKKEQDFEAEVNDTVSTVEPLEPSLDKRVMKPVVNKDEIDPFGWN